MNNNLIKTIKAEYIKKRKAKLSLLAILIGATVPVITLLNAVYENRDNYSRYIENYYLEAITINLSPYASFLLPLFLIIAASKISQIDHKNSGWQLMETLPTSKFAIFFSKYLVLLQLSLLSIIAYMLICLLLAWIRSIFFLPSDSYLMALPVIEIIKLTVAILFGTLAISAIQHVFSVLIKSFVWPILIGFVSLLATMFTTFNFGFVAYANPYNFLMELAKYPSVSDVGNWFTYIHYLSVVYSIIILYVGYNWYQYKRPKTAFFKTTKRTVVLLLVIISGSLLAFYIVKPKVQNSHNRTVITGKVVNKGYYTNNRILILERFTNDTITKIDIGKNGTFKKVITDSVHAGDYLVRLDDYSLTDLFFGQNDSIHLQLNFSTEFKPKVIISGTRITENLSNQVFQNNYPSYKRRLMDNDWLLDHDWYMEEITKLWQESVADVKYQRSIDNFESRNDFKKRAQKLISLQYLNDWNDYKEKLNFLHPQTDFEPTSDILALENTIQDDDITLINDYRYVDYVQQKLIADDHREVSQDMKILEAITKINPGRFKNNLIFGALSKMMTETDDIAYRDSIVSAYQYQIENSAYRNILNSKRLRLNKFGKGSPAHNFKAVGVDNELVTLGNFKGKFLVIDVWASWCAPCKMEDPYFEKKALQFKDNNVQFASINVDDNEVNWKMAIANKGKSIIQLKSEKL